MDYLLANTSGVVRNPVGELRKSTLHAGSPGYPPPLRGEEIGLPAASMCRGEVGSRKGGREVLGGESALLQSRRISSNPAPAEYF